MVVILTTTAITIMAMALVVTVIKEDGNETPLLGIIETIGRLPTGEDLLLIGEGLQIVMSTTIDQEALEVRTEGQGEAGTNRCRSLEV